MSYQEITQYDSKNFTPAADVPAVFGQPRNVQSITIHWWGSYGQQFLDVVKFLCTNNTPTSAHYVAEAGRVACLVSPDDAAWHAGNAAGNASSIGIECRPEATDGDYATVAELVAELRQTYGNIPLKAHRDWYNTACPGVWDLARIDRLARTAITPQSTKTKPQETTLSAAEVNQIKAAIAADGAKTRDYIKKLAYSGWQDDKGKQHPGFMLVIEENQRRIDGLGGAK